MQNFKKMTDENRLAMLQAMSIDSGVFSYTRDLTEQELEEKTQYYLEIIKKIQDEDVILAKAKAAHKAAVAGPKETASELFNIIYNKKQPVEETVYHVPDLEAGELLYITASGEVVYSMPYQGNGGIFNVPGITDDEHEENTDS